MNEFEEGESDDEEDDGEEEGEEGEDDEGGYYGDGGMTRAMNESRQAYYGQDQAAGSSRAASAYAPAYPHGKLCPLANLQRRSNNFQPRSMILLRHRELWILQQLISQVQ